MDFLNKPENKDTLHLIVGLSGPGNQVINNLNDIFFEMVTKLQEGDVMMLGGDYVQFCSDCCINASSDICGGGNYPSVLRSGKTQTQNPDPNALIITITDPKSCSCNNNINSGDIALSCCEKNTVYSGKSDVLINETLNAMKRGARIIWLDDLYFVSTVYPANKPVHDYILQRLKTSDNFYYYPISSWNRPPQNLHTHAKICHAWYLDSSNGYQNSYQTGIWGSYNPDFPMSEPTELSMIVTGLSSNGLIQIMTVYMISLCFFFLHVEPSKVPGTQNLDKSQLPSVGSQVYDGFWFRPTKSNITMYELLEPVTDILVMLGTKNSNLPKKGGIIDLWSIPASFYQPVTVKTVKTCGKKLDSFCESYTRKANEPQPYDRIYMVDTDVEFSFGANSIWGAGNQTSFTFTDDWICGLNLVKSIFTEAKEFVKVGLYGEFAECGLTDKGGNSCNGCCSYPDSQFVLRDTVSDTDVPIFLIENGPKDIKITDLNSKNVNIRWFTPDKNVKYGVIHWKFYMNEDSLLFSTQHPISWFYQCGNSQAQAENEGALGYDLKIKNSKNLVSYFNTLYQYFWTNKTTKSKLPGPELLPCSDGSKGCCKFSSNVCNNCYPGGLGTPEKPPSSIDDTWKTIAIISLIVLGIILLTIAFVLFKNSKSKIYPK